MHKWVEIVDALDPKKAIAHGDGPHPSRPARLQDLLRTPDLLPDIDQPFRPLRKIFQRHLRIFVPLGLSQDHGIQRADRYAGNLAEITMAVNNEMVDRARLERSFEAPSTKHQCTFLCRVAVVGALCRG